MRPDEKLHVHAGRRRPRGDSRSAPARPRTPRSTELGPGEVGYLIAGIKDVGDARSGETVTTASQVGPPSSVLPGYQDPKPMVFSGLFPIDGDDFDHLRESLEKLKLNDASITYTPESSGALGFGFRCGFLGLLHMEIVKERLEREFGLALIATAPSASSTGSPAPTVSRRSSSTTPPTCPRRQKLDVRSRSRTSRCRSSRPPTTRVPLMDLCQSRRGEMKKMEYLSPERVELVYELPLAEVVVDFFDQMKSRTKGYASLDYELVGYRPPTSSRSTCSSTANRPTRSPPSSTATPPTSTADGCARSSRSSSRARCSTCRSRRRSAARSSPARR